jgi:CheY-like chemotaxis protein
MTSHQSDATIDTSARTAGGSLVLVVEDNRADVVLLKRAFTMAGIACDLAIARDGQEAIEYLQQSPSPQNAHLLIDLQLPRVSGLELLAWIRGKSETRNLPAIVLSSSEQEIDKNEARRFGIDGYFVKPGNMQEFVEAASRIAAIWNLPRRDVMQPSH